MNRKKKFMALLKERKFVVQKYKDVHKCTIFIIYKTYLIRKRKRKEKKKAHDSNN